MSLPTPYYDKDGITIYHGDCREILPELGAGEIDAVVTDPPYGVGFSRYDMHDDSASEYELLMGQVIGECVRVLKDGGIAFVWQGMKNADKWHRWFPDGFRLFAALRNFTQFLPTPVQYSWDPVVWWANGKSDRKAIAGQRDYHMGNTARWICEKRNGHPCPRPLDTTEYVVGLASSEDELILDPFMGSGTTLVAAKKLGRKCIGIEISQEYCDIAVERLRQKVLAYA